MRAGDRRLGHAEVFAGIAAASFATARLLPLLSLGWPCPFRAATGIPCASCGMTRAFVHLAHGEVARSLSASPAGAVLAASAWAFALLALGRLLLGRPWPALPAGAGRAAALTGVAALLANWAYLVVAHRT
jgi:Protein of unknown function (DUF2752)